MTAIFTVGHSTQSYEAFLGLLRLHRVTALADVRSTPRSRLVSHFDKDELSQSLKADGIAYIFLGRELGGRPRDAALFRHGVADYEAMARTPAFLEGVERLQRGARQFRIALMCSERSPLECHRCLLVGRVLSEKGYDVCNILGDGRLASQREIEEYLLKSVGTDHSDLFKSQDERLDDAYRAQSIKVAYRFPTGESFTSQHTDDQ